MDPHGVLALPAGDAVDEAAPEDTSPLDDGDARHERAAASASIVRVTGGASETHQCHWREAEQDGGDGAVRPAPPQLQDQPQDEQRAGHGRRGRRPRGKRMSQGERELRLDFVVAGSEQGDGCRGIYRRALAQRRSLHSGERHRRRRTVDYERFIPFFIYSLRRARIGSMWPWSSTGCSCTCSSL